MWKTQTEEKLKKKLLKSIENQQQQHQNEQKIESYYLSSDIM